MADQQAYIIIDIGTGNVRVAVTKTNGEILSVERDDVHYEKDDRYPDALHFDPNRLWLQIIELSRKALLRAPGVTVKAITASSQREGIVLLDGNGKALIGLPNHDHRGREWEDTITGKSKIYTLTGRYPSSLFSAFKVLGIKNKRPEIFQKLRTIISISDWAQYQLSGVMGYEHSQASETQLYNVAARAWSKELCTLFGLPESLLPPLQASGTVLGKVLPTYAAEPNISPDAAVIVGGADTQLAIRSTQPAVDDIVIVSGTTTPIVKIIDRYIIDTDERTWTNRHIDKDSFILEANAGVTGLNYQRLKEIFYPNEGYDVIEKELAALPASLCMASLGSLVADEKAPMTRGGFIFSTPVTHQLTRASFVWATLWDIACCIKENYDCLTNVTDHTSDYVWACGGGFQSTLLRQCIASLINKKVKVREGFRQASVAGGALVCNDALKINEPHHDAVDVVVPQAQHDYHALYMEWKKVRAGLKQIFTT